jgi:hypothetical protein
MIASLLMDDAEKPPISGRSTASGGKLQKRVLPTTYSGEQNA